MTPLTGRALRFDRTGRRLLVVEPTELAIVDVVGGAVLRIAEAARAACMAGDQIWVANRDDQLVRYDVSGRALGEPIALPVVASPHLEPAPCGSPSAIVGGVSLLDDFGTMVRIELGDELAIPLTGRRHLVVRGARVTLPSGTSLTLAPGSTVSGGAVMQDGNTFVLAVAHGGGRQLVLGSLSSSQILQRCSVPATTVHLATRRGHAIVQVAARTLACIELRSGRQLGAIELAYDVTDFAVDADGARVVVRSERGDLEVHAIAEHLARVTVPAAPVVAPEPVATHLASAPVALVASEAATPAPRMLPVLQALQPRARRPELDRGRARRALDSELRGIALLALRAIAAAWDTRSLGYGNEGRHPYELEVSALLGLGGGFAADHVAAAAEQLAAHERALDPELRGPATAIGALVSELGLSAREVDVVLVIAAASLQGEIARLFGILANDPGRPIVDELLVQQVLAGRHDRYDVATELDPTSPLVRLGIVHVTGRRRPFAELAIDPVVLDRLRAEPPTLGAGTTVRTADWGLRELDLPAAVLERACDALAMPSTSPVRIAVRGVAGCGRRALLAALAAAAGLDLAIIAASALPRGAEPFVVALRAALRSAQLAGLFPCVVELDQVAFEERAGRDVASEVLRAHPGPLALVTHADAPIPFAAGHVLVDLPILAETERRLVWTRVLAAANLAADPDRLAARFRIGPGAIRRAVAAASPDDPTGTIEAFIRQTRDARLGQFARRVDRLAAWADIVLPPDILDSLRELVARVRHRRTVFEDWGMGRTMATSRGLTALFQGQPGTGKTLVAGVVARELGLELYRVDLSKVMSKWIGETERNLATIFDAAEDGQVILLFDEADSLFSKRTEVRSSNDRYANLEVNYLLQRLDSFEGIAMLTTNSGGSIDPAFKRRLSFCLSFPFPDEDTREQLWRAHLPPELPTAGTFALDALARKYQLSGGYIRNACLRAAFLAAQEESVLHQHHLERAVALEFAELGKLSSGGAID
ncbi:MAG: ATP-binding protein [Kofleriaceae bacterium]